MKHKILFLLKIWSDLKSKPLEFSGYRKSMKERKIKKWYEVSVIETKRKRSFCLVVLNWERNINISNYKCWSICFPFEISQFLDNVFWDSVARYLCVYNCYISPMYQSLYLYKMSFLLFLVPLFVLKSICLLITPAACLWLLIA